MSSALEFDGSITNLRQSFTLNGEVFFITTYWNNRIGWQFTLENSTQDILLSLARVMPYASLLRSYTLPDKYDGVIICVDTAPTDSDEITIDNFGTNKRFQLWYYTTDELRTLAANT